MQLKAIFEQEIKDIREISNQEIESAVKVVLKNLEKDSPKKTGKYSKSWKKKKTVEELNMLSITVYNEKGQLTHLLEHGHMTRNGTSRTRAFPHIKKNEAIGNEMILKNIKDRIESR